MKLAPPAVTREVSVVNCSGADLASAAGAAACIMEAKIVLCVRVANARRTRRAIRRVVMSATTVERLGNPPQRYTTTRRESSRSRWNETLDACFASGRAGCSGLLLLQNTQLLFL